jgi:hypothetical protein
MTETRQDNKQDQTRQSSAVADSLGALGKGRRFQWGLVAGAAVAVAAALLVIQNGQQSTVHWLWLDFETKLWLLVAVSLAAGMVIAEAGRLAWRHSRSRASGRRELLTAADQRLRTR